MSDLAQHPFFQGLTPSALAALEACARPASFAPGAFLFREGAVADACFAILSGRVALEVATPGRGALTIETLEPGSILGWSWLFPPFRWHFDARALSPINAIALDGAQLRTQADADPTLGYELMKRFAQVITRRLQQTRLQLLNLYEARHEPSSSAIA